MISSTMLSARSITPARRRERVAKTSFFSMVVTSYQPRNAQEFGFCALF
jgi:hypothetical protein